jgi:hypothetical protein
MHNTTLLPSAQLKQTRPPTWQLVDTQWSNSRQRPAGHFLWAVVLYGGGKRPQGSTARRREGVLQRTAKGVQQHLQYGRDGLFRQYDTKAGVMIYVLA